MYLTNKVLELFQRRIYGFILACEAYAEDGLATCDSERVWGQLTLAS